VVVSAAFAQATVLLANSRESTSLPTFVNRIADPVDSWIATNSLVVRINQDDFIVLVNTILVHPVRVEYSQIPTTPSHTLLCRTPERPLEF